jgi:hypothetical protein
MPVAWKDASFRGAFRRNHTCDGGQIGEAGTVIQRDFFAGNQNKAESGKAAGEDGGGHLKAGNERDGDGGGEHDDDLLKRVKEQL